MAVAGAWFAGQRKGRVNEKQKQEARKADAMRQKQETDHEVQGMDDTRLDDELARWMRKDRR